MPKFYFDFREGGRQTHDSEGLQLDSAECAKREAMTALSQLLQLEGRSDDHRYIECYVRNDWNVEVYSVSLSYKGTWRTPQGRPFDAHSSSRFSLVSRMRL